MPLRRLMVLSLALALACSDSGGPDDDGGTVKPPADLTILRLAEGSPPLFSTVLVNTDSAHWAIVSLIVFFIGGLALVFFVNVQQGRQEARAAEAEAPQSR